MAWERYTLAAQAVDYQLCVKDALTHKEVVLEVAFSAKAGGRTELLGVLYDELARSGCRRVSLRLRRPRIYILCLGRSGRTCRESWVTAF